MLKLQNTIKVSIKIIVMYKRMMNRKEERNVRFDEVQVLFLIFLMLFTFYSI